MRSPREGDPGVSSRSLGLSFARIDCVLSCRPLGPCRQRNDALPIHVVKRIVDRCHAFCRQTCARNRVQTPRPLAVFFTLASPLDQGRYQNYCRVRCEIDATSNQETMLRFLSKLRGRNIALQYLSRWERCIAVQTLLVLSGSARLSRR